jgi:hypothetical protein
VAPQEVERPRFRPGTHFACGIRRDFWKFPLAQCQGKGQRMLQELSGQGEPKGLTPPAQVLRPAQQAWSHLC